MWCRHTDDCQRLHRQNQTFYSIEATPSLKLCDSPGFANRPTIPAFSVEPPLARLELPVLQNGRPCHLDLVWREHIFEDNEACLFKLGEIACFFFAAQHSGCAERVRPPSPVPRGPVHGVSS